MPDYSLFTRVRTGIGPTRLSQMFATMLEQLKAARLMSEVFTFVDATHLICESHAVGKTRYCTPTED